MQTDNVLQAFEILLEEIEQVADTLHRQGATAFEERRLEDVKALVDAAERHSSFQSRVRALRQEWLVANPAEAEDAKVPVSKRDLGRLNRGLRTPDEMYRIPLLESLVELGGAGKLQTVTDLVGQKMKGTLNDYDREPLPSEPNELRWRNTVAWMRWTLVQEGLMVKGSPRGTWEISDLGRKALQKAG